MNELWLPLCPLAQWRAESAHRTQADTAGRVGVSVNTIRSWEQGVSAPNEGNMVKLAIVMDRPLVDRAWSDWLAARPSPVAQ